MTRTNGSASTRQLLTAADVVRALEPHSDSRRIPDTLRYFNEDDARGDQWWGIKMGTVLDLTKRCLQLPLDQVETLLESDVHEVRVAGVKSMARQAGHRSTTAAHLNNLADLYLRRHDRIDNWDLVDLGAWDVLGRSLQDRDRDILYELADSANKWERRSSQLAPLWFIRRTGEIHDALALATRLVRDPEPLVNKATGGILREVGKVDRDALLEFLQGQAANVPAVTFRYATERLDPETRARLRREIRA